MIYGEMEVRCTEVELARTNPDEECLLACVPSLCETIRAAWTERDEAQRALNAERTLMLAKYDEQQAKLDAAHEQIGAYRAQVRQLREDIRRLRNEYAGAPAFGGIVRKLTGILAETEPSDG